MFSRYRRFWSNLDSRDGQLSLWYRSSWQTWRKEVGTPLNDPKVCHGRHSRDPRSVKQKLLTRNPMTVGTTHGRTSYDLPVLRYEYTTQVQRGPVYSTSIPHVSKSSVTSRLETREGNLSAHQVEPRGSTTMCLYRFNPTSPVDLEGLLRRTSRVVLRTSTVSFAAPRGQCYAPRP